MLNSSRNAKKAQPEPQEYNLTRVNPTTGLTPAQVKERQALGLVNKLPSGNTPSVGAIICKHTFTLFNFINLMLAIAVIAAGSPRNALFLGVAIINTIMGVVQDVRAKKVLDKLTVLSRSKVKALRSGAACELDIEQLVLDDLVYIKTGNQIYADGILVQSTGIEVDESLLTGEANRIQKNAGDVLLSGSFLTSGSGLMQLTAVGENSYANRLTNEARRLKRATTPLMRTLNNIIRVLTFAIIPIGGLLFYQQYQTSDFTASVLSATASVIGMIPEGLILLTTVTLTVGAMRLVQKKALVQNLNSIETLARIDVLCLDKTGTITDGSLTLQEVIPAEGYTELDIRQTIHELMAALPDDNPTAVALRSNFDIGQAYWRSEVTVPFSSARKWSGATFDVNGTYAVGAPSFLLPPQQQKELAPTLQEYAKKGLRVLCLVYSKQPFTNGVLPAKRQNMGLIVLADTVRPEAAGTFAYFRREGVTLKVISGDDPISVAAIASRAGIENAGACVDMSRYVEIEDYQGLVEKYTVFGRVSPEQKKLLVAALKQHGHTVCMTGDGVNDVLAMKEADCSVAMVSGSDAARNASEFVLMSSDFSAMIDVLREGRRVINNIENVACLYLIKTIYSVLLSLLYTFIPFSYPFLPIQMQPVNSLTVGIPSFVLALRDNFKKPEGRFLLNALEHSLPAALAVVINALIIQLAGLWFDIPHAETSSMTVLLTGFVGFLVLYKLTAKQEKWLKIFVGVLAALFLCYTFPIPLPVIGSLSGFFMLEGIWTRNVFFWIPQMALSWNIYFLFHSFVLYAEKQLLPPKPKKADLD